MEECSKKFQLPVSKVLSIVNAWKKRRASFLLRPRVLGSDGRWSVPQEPPLLTVLNYSGGMQSTALLWMVIRGEIPRPKNLIVLNADPGMENSETYRHVAMMMAECQRAGVEARTVSGPNLYQDILAVASGSKTRLDNPSFFTRAASGKKGRLRRCCTAYYKIAPMDREVRRVLQRRFGISARSRTLPQGIVEKWIGFSFEEQLRMRSPQQRYVRFRFPLIELQMSRRCVSEYFSERELPLPPRSICNACFAQRVDDYQEMHLNRPADWKQAVEVDRAVRDWTAIGVRDPVFVSDALVPLEELPDRGFPAVAESVGETCESGYCFL